MKSMHRPFSPSLRLYPALALVLAPLLSGCIATYLDESVKYEPGPSTWRHAEDSKTRLIVLSFDRQEGTINGEFQALTPEEEVGNGRTRIRKTPKSYTANGKVFTPTQASLGYWMLLPLSMLSSMSSGGSGLEVNAWGETREEIPGQEPTGRTRTTTTALSGARVDWSAALPEERAAKGTITTDEDGEWSIPILRHPEIIKAFEINLDLIDSIKVDVWAVGSSANASIELEAEWIISALEARDNGMAPTPVVPPTVETFDGVIQSPQEKTLVDRVEQGQSMNEEVYMASTTIDERLKKHLVNRAKQRAKLYAEMNKAIEDGNGRLARQKLAVLRNGYLSEEQYEHQRSRVMAVKGNWR